MSIVCLLQDGGFCTNLEGFFCGSRDGCKKERLCEVQRMNLKKIIESKVKITREQFGVEK